MPTTASKQITSVLAAAAALASGAVASVCLGAVDLDLPTVWAALLGDGEATTVAIVRDLRAPRTFAAAVSGGCLAAAGVALQAAFRNPLADPALLGVSAGGACGAALALVVLPAFVGLSLGVPLLAFCGALLTTALLWRVSLWRGRPDVARMLLAGLALNALAGGVLGLALHLADQRALRSLTGWMLGSFAGTLWTEHTWAVAISGVAIFALLRMARTLDALLLGEQGARQLGVSPERTLRAISLWVALGVGASVSVAGIVGFIGLVVPHSARLLMGPTHKRLLPVATLGGAALTVWADVGARTLAPPRELPLGVLTCLIGAPFFLWLITSKRLGRMW